MDADVLRDLALRALNEDAAGNDVTTLATVPVDARGHARLIAHEPCVVAGLAVVDACFRMLDDTLAIEHHAAEGDHVGAGTTVVTVAGLLRPILGAERTALNFVQRLSGIATLGRAFVDAAGGVEVRDTRKTTPGLRALEKEAARAGGVHNHRVDLAGGILIKDNHIAAAGGITAAVRAARAGNRWVEVECDTLDQVREACDAGADEVLLDNMDTATLAEAVAIVNGRARMEASGGVTLETIAVIAKTGVDAVSVGAITHSARAIDMSLAVEVAR